MKRILSIMCVLLAFFAIGNYMDSLTEKVTVTDLFRKEGGLAAYCVDREYGSDYYIDYYMIIDFNNSATYSFGGELIHLFIDEISNIEDDSFQVGGREYSVSLSRGLNSISAETIKFSRTNRTNYLSRVDLSEAQRLADRWRRTYGEEDRR